MAGQNSTSSESTAGAARGRPGAGPRRLLDGRWVVVLVATLIALGILFLDLLEPRKTEHTSAETRMPVANPLLEPDRPDLIGEPRIEE